MELVAAVRGNDRSGPVRVADQVGDQVERRRVGPVKVLERDHQRPRHCGPTEQRPHRVEHAAGNHRLRDRNRLDIAERRANVRREARKIACDPGAEGAERRVVGAAEQRVDCGRDRCVRQWRVDEGQTAADDDPDTMVVGLTGQLTDEPALADAGLAADRTVSGSPVAPRATVARSSASSSSRPTMTGLEILRAIKPIIRSPSCPRRFAGVVRAGFDQRASPRTRRDRPNSTPIECGAAASGSWVGDRRARRWLAASACMRRIWSFAAWSRSSLCPFIASAFRPGRTTSCRPGESESRRAGRRRHRGDEVFLRRDFVARP